MKILSTILFLVLFFSYTFSAKVVRIVDGDGIEVNKDQNQQVYIRLESIDCPEKGQYFETRAKQTTSDLCFGKTVRVEQTGIDRFGRMLTNVYVGNVCVNKELIKQRIAWHYKQYNNKDPELAKLENQAREAKTGTMGCEGAVPPWEWRRK
jgi:endonuclease YncB( thermonuclease family)